VLIVELPVLNAQNTGRQVADWTATLTIYTWRYL